MKINNYSKRRPLTFHLVSSSHQSFIFVLHISLSCMTPAKYHVKIGLQSCQHGISLQFFVVFLKNSQSIHFPPFLWVLAQPFPFCGITTLLLSPTFFLSIFEVTARRVYQGYRVQTQQYWLTVILLFQCTETSSSPFYYQCLSPQWCSIHGNSLSSVSYKFDGMSVPWWSDLHEIKAHSNELDSS